jgi:TatA/E family protein of Tat protein translocase
MPFNIQGPELILILIIALIVIGPGKLPEVGSALGKSIREFRKASSDVRESTSLDARPVAPSGSPSTPTAPASAAPAPTAPAPAVPATPSEANAGDPAPS